MVVAKQKLTKKKIITYVAIILLMVVGNIVVYLRNSKTNISVDDGLAGLDGAPSPIVGDSPVGGSATGVVHKGDQAILDNELFNALKKIGDWPVVPKNVGKADPFAPFFSGQ
jgi:hypothetical protein